MGIFNFSHKKNNGNNKTQDGGKPANFSGMQDYNENIESISKIVKKENDTINFYSNLNKTHNFTKPLKQPEGVTQKFIPDNNNNNGLSLNEKLRNARMKVNALQKELPNDNEELIRRLNKRRELSKEQYEQQDFQKVLDDIKKRNFDQRMDRMYKRIQLANRDNKDNSYWETTRSNLSPSSLLNPNNKRRPEIINKSYHQIKRPNPMQGPPEIDMTIEHYSESHGSKENMQNIKDKKIQLNHQSINPAGVPNFYNNPYKNNDLKQNHNNENNVDQTIKTKLNENTVTMTVSQLNKIVKNTVNDVIKNMKNKK
ncbi:hypothetical protein [Spiroplasma endosymbiont of Amphibalanus improvisus]|uniref:hypothetical protein n=1 Tax=Spiroplasma endosymbiont of Amphibalanus improvisus TaxID=3066327 RepID=UPI00313D0E39